MHGQKFSQIFAKKRCRTTDIELQNGENITQIDCVLLSDDVTIMTSSSRKVVCMFRIKFPTKRIFRTFLILRTDGMAPFCSLFMERLSCYVGNKW